MKCLNANLIEVFEHTQQQINIEHARSANQNQG